MDFLLQKYKNQAISSRSLIISIKNSIDLINELESRTSFLDTYNSDITERIYCLVNNINTPIKCKYCDNKAKWSGRFKDGYKTTCCSKECESKRISEQKQGQTIISVNRDNTFIEWQKSVTYINDDIVKEHIKYDKYIQYIDNSVILDYLNNRFKDSSSIEETLKRIELSIEEKPKCPVCGKPVIFVGRKARMFTKYCSESCGARSEETTKKKKETQLKNWGTENCYDSDKYKQLMKEKYGVEYTIQRQDIKDKRKNTLIEKYGTDVLYDIPGVREKVQNTNKEKYGYPCVLVSPSIRLLAHDKLNQNAKYGTSEQETEIYNWLIQLGYNVERHHMDDIFPYNVDFYFPDYNLYMEYQGSQYHNGRAYLGNKDDIKEVEELKTKDIERNKITNKDTQYQGIINTWTKWDVNKRNFAINNHINYLEIYDCKSINDIKFQLEFYLNCLQHKNPFNINPDDLYNEYNYYLNLNDSNKLKLISSDMLCIKQFQGDLFYKKEIDLFANDILIRRKLIQNRVKYLNKKERELNANNILSGFKKSGIYYGYSHFNPQWTNWFINKFHIETIYDPCGGWGHHLLGMLKCKKIIYNDLSQETAENIRNMKKYFNIENLIIENQNAIDYIPDNVDAFFMCPPYYNVEDYGNNFKNINEYTDFLNKIFDIWSNNSAKIFGLIIREDFIDLIKYKWYECYEVPMNKIHLISEKKNKEYFYIFKK
jgi:hypothetical protein